LNKCVAICPGSMSPSGNSNCGRQSCYHHVGLDTLC
jgi:hypothetical protein